MDDNLSPSDTYQIISSDLSSNTQSPGVPNSIESTVMKSDDAFKDELSLDESKTNAKQELSQSNGHQQQDDQTNEPESNEKKVLINEHRETINTFLN